MAAVEQPSSYLATVPGPTVAPPAPVYAPGYVAPRMKGGMMGAWYYNPLAWIVAVIVTWVIILAILFMLQPSFVTRTDSSGHVHLDRGKLFGWSIGITIVILILLWVFASAC